MKVGILGAGGFGTALAVTTNSYGYQTTIWSAVKEELEDIRKNNENTKLLKGIKVDKSIKLTEDIKDLKDCDIIILAVASVYLRETAKKLSKILNKETIIVNVAKGLEDKTFKMLSEVIKEEIKNNPIVILSGPSHAEEIAKQIPTTIVASSKEKEAAKKVQEVLSSNFLRIYLNDDIIGTQMGGALKNVIAIAAGICDGLGYGDNTKAALITRGMTEIKRLGVKAGGKETTFFGLTGIGDLIVTCTSIHSRNYRAGYKIGQGKTANEALKEVAMTVEGYYATKVAYQLKDKFETSMPITTALYDILFKNKSPKLALNELMNRPYKEESEDLLTI